MSFKEQITSKDKYSVTEHIIVPNEGYCVYYPSNIFRNMHSFGKQGISLGLSSVLAGAYSVTQPV